MSKNRQKKFKNRVNLNASSSFSPHKASMNASELVSAAQLGELHVNDTIAMDFVT